MANATLIEKNDHHTGVDVWAVKFTDKTGRGMQTSWTKSRGEACAWGRGIELTGWSASGRPMNVARVTG